MSYKLSMPAALFYSTIAFAAATLPFYSKPLAAFAEPTDHSRLNQKVSEVINILRAGKEFRQFQCKTHWMGIGGNEATIYAEHPLIALELEYKRNGLTISDKTFAVSIDEMTMGMVGANGAGRTLSEETLIEKFGELVNRAHGYLMNADKCQEVRESQK